MCGREPNFELSEEEKQELKKFKWDEFLAITRSAINNKSNLSFLVFVILSFICEILMDLLLIIIPEHKRRIGAGLHKRSDATLQNGDWDNKQGVNGFSASEDVEPDSSASWDSGFKMRLNNIILTVQF